MDLVKAVLNGERLALARLITKIENQSPDGFAALDKLFPFTGKAHLIGVTGSPGSGKSSLVNQLVMSYRKSTESGRASRVAVVAVDPTSPFSGGALLGDRVRMRDLMGDPDVFIRSMASRGALGGLAHTTAAVVQVLDAAGYDKIVIETVGAGQTEVDIARLAHTVVAVEAPGMGDDIQAIKAGILEIADILVVNKSDRSGAENTVRALRSMLELARPDVDTSKVESRDARADLHGVGDELLWQPVVVQTIATQGTGIDELWQKIQAHFAYLERSDTREERDRQRLTRELERLVQETLVSRWKGTLSPDKFAQIVDKLVLREISPQEAVGILLDSNKDST